MFKIYNNTQGCCVSFGGPSQNLTETFMVIALI